MAAVVWSQASGSVGANGNSPDQGAGAVNACRLDVNVTAVTGSVQFFVEGKGLDGVYYVLYNTAALSATGPASQSIGPGLQTAVLVPDTVRVRWVIVTGPVTFSAQLLGDVV